VIAQHNMQGLPITSDIEEYRFLGTLKADRVGIAVFSFCGDQRIGPI